MASMILGRKTAVFTLLFLIIPHHFFGQEWLEDNFEFLPPEQRIIAYNDAADRLDMYDGGMNLIYDYSHRALFLLETYPDKEQSARVYHNLARVNFYLGRLKAALSDARNAERLAQNTATQYQILLLLVKIYEKNKLYPEALKTCSRLSKFKQSDRINLLLDEARILQAMNFPSLAVTKAEDALELSQKASRPQEVSALLELANATQKNNPQQALLIFRRAVLRAEHYQITSYLSQAYFSLGQAFQSLGNANEAVFYGQKALLANRDREVNTLNSKIYALLYEAFLALNQTTQAINMLKLQYQNDLMLITEKQNLNETFFDGSIQVKRMELQINNLERQKKKMIIFLSIFFLLILILLVFTALIINQLTQRDARLQAALVAYNSLKNRAEALEKNQVQNHHLLLQQNSMESRGVLIISIENYKELRKLFGDIAMDYCRGHISRIICDLLNVSSTALSPITNNAQAFCIIWPVKNYSDFCNSLKKINTGMDFTKKIRWQQSEIDVKTKISTYYQADKKN